MNGKALLAKLLGSSAAPAAVVAVAAGVPDLSAEQSTAGTERLEGLVAEAHAEGEKAGRQAERERFGAVLTSDEAGGAAIGLAITLLSTTDNTPDQIKAALAAAPKGGELAELQPVEPPAGSSPAQGAAKDPLKPGAEDPIARDTPLVEVGKAPEQEALEEKAVVDLWAGALNAANGGGVGADSPWSGLTAARAN